jgi:hypothetical protein
MCMPITRAPQLHYWWLQCIRHSSPAFLFGAQYCWVSYNLADCKAEMGIAEGMECCRRSKSAVSKFYGNNKERLGLDIVLEQAGFDEVPQ